MSNVLIVGAGGVSTVTIQKMAMLPKIFTNITLASRTLEKCEYIQNLVQNKYNIDIMHTIFQKFFLFILISFLITIIYYHIPDNHFGGDISNNNKLLNCFYYSIISGSTVGFGDIYPKSNLTKIIVIFQVFFLFLIISY
jgi:hypothetical protein